MPVKTDEIPDDFDFNLEPKSKRIKLGGVPHVLREATEEAAAARSNSALKTIRFEGDVTHGAANAECDAILLQKCLFKLTLSSTDGSVLVEQPVTLAFVKGLPSRVSKPLVDWVEKNSDLVTKKGEEDSGPKDVPSAGAPSSA